MDPGYRVVVDPSSALRLTACGTITYSDNTDGGFLIPPELTAELNEIVTANNATGTTWTGTGVYFHPGYYVDAEKRADTLLKQSFPKFHKQFNELGYCEFDSTLYPVSYHLTSSRAYVQYKEKQIGFICVSASYSMPPSDRILQMLLHFKKDEAYVLRVGNWNANIGHSALKHFEKSFVKKGGKLVYRPKKKKKGSWWDIGNLEWAGLDIGYE